MLALMQSLAARLQPAAPWVAALGVIALSVAVLLVLFGGAAGDDRALLPLVVAVVWCLIFWLFITTFESVPAPAGPTKGVWSRLKRHTARLWYRLLALTLVCLTVAAVMLSIRLVGSAFG
jgi:hypothetical protein